MSNQTVFLTSLAFNLFWFLTVWGQNQFLWLSVLLLIVCWWVFNSALRFSLSVAIPGMLMDFGMMQLGVYQFPGDNFPIWLGVLWLGFSSFVWIMRSKILSMPASFVILLGGIGGTLSYCAGERLQAVIFPFDLIYTLAAIMASWCAFSVVLLRWLKASHRSWGEAKEKDSHQ